MWIQIATYVPYLTFIFMLDIEYRLIVDGAVSGVDAVRYEIIPAPYEQSNDGIRYGRLRHIQLYGRISKLISVNAPDAFYNCENIHLEK